MVVRSLVASTFLAGHLVVGTAQAQVLLCPEAPAADVAAGDVSRAAERLLTRLTIAFDLHGHRGIDETAIMQAHAETPSALLAKLSNVVDRCMMSSGDLELFHEALPDLRKTFLEAVDVAAVEDRATGDREQVEAALDLSKAERLEEAIDMSVRELWRKLWFRPDDGVVYDDERWAVIVASPTDAESGWEMLDRYQRRWIDTYFQLHEPYYDSNPHHAIVVGRRLPLKQANRLRDYVVELGMADDAFLWPLPEESQPVVSRLEPKPEPERDQLAVEASVIER